jgi:hypothetical protein
MINTVLQRCHMFLANNILLVVTSYNVGKYMCAFSHDDDSNKFLGPVFYRATC